MPHRPRPLSEQSAGLQRLIQGLALHAIGTGCSGATTFHAGPYILKLDDPEAEAQAVRLGWLAGRLPVPRVIWYDAQTLLVEAIPGSDASERRACDVPPRLRGP